MNEAIGIIFALIIGFCLGSMLTIYLMSKLTDTQEQRIAENDAAMEEVHQINLKLIAINSAYKTRLEGSTP